MSSFLSKIVNNAISNTINNNSNSNNSNSGSANNSGNLARKSNNSLFGLGSSSGDGNNNNGSAGGASGVAAKAIKINTEFFFGSDPLDKALTPRKFAGNSPFPVAQTPSTRKGGEPNIAASNNDDSGNKFTSVVTLAQEELIKSLPEEYSQPNFDAVAFVLERLEKVSEEEIGKEKKRLETTLDAVNTKLTQLVVETSDSFVKGLSLIHEMTIDLESTTQVCQKGRHHLENAKRAIATEGFLILSKWKLKKRYGELSGLVGQLSQLIRNYNQMLEFTRIGRFPDAIDLCSQCHKDANALRNLKWVQNNMSVKLSESYESIENAMEAAINQSTKNFDALKYENAILGFRLLGKSSKIAELQHSSFADRMHNESQACISSFLTENDPDPVKNSSKLEKLQKSPFKELCSMLDGDVSFRKALNLLCSSLYLSMCQYQLVVDWFLNREKEVNSELISFYQETRTKIEKNKRLIWEDIQRKVGMFLASKSQLADQFPFDSLVEVLKTCHKLIWVGDEFASISTASSSVTAPNNQASNSGGNSNNNSTPSAILKTLCRQYSLTYLSNFHAKRVDDLVTLLANEIWKPVPVQGNFSILSLPEFQYLALAIKASESANNSNSSPLSSAVEGPTLSRLKPENNPFASTANRTKSDDRGNSAIVPISPSGPTASSDSLLTSTTFSVVRTLGRYLKMNDNMSSISSEVLMALGQYVELYIYAVYCYFTSDVKISDNGIPLLVSSRVKFIINRFKDAFGGDPSSSNQLDNLASQLLANSNNLNNATNNTSNNSNNNNTVSSNNGPSQGTTSGPGFNLNSRKIRIPPLSKQVVLNSPATLYGLLERLVAVESLTFLKHCIKDASGKSLQSCATWQKGSTTAATTKDLFVQFNQQICDVLQDIRQLSLNLICRKLVNIEPLLSQITNNCKWDTNELGTAHNQYIDSVLREYQQFSNRLLSLNANNNNCLSKEVIQGLWDPMIRYAINFLIEGFSRVKRCTNEGRASMQLDSKVLLGALEKQTDLRPLPLVNVLNDYIKAFYLDENALESWIKSHRDNINSVNNNFYSPKQLLNLIQLLINNATPNSVAASGIQSLMMMKNAVSNSNSNSGNNSNNNNSSNNSGGGSESVKKLKARYGPLMDDLEKINFSVTLNSIK